MNSLPLKPVVSEKAYQMSEKKVYVFNVPISANAESISKAVTSQFNVSVENVRTLIQRGKPKRTIRKRQRPAQSKRSDYKKAYVTVSAKDSINIFGQEEKKTKPKQDSKNRSVEAVDSAVEKKKGLRGAFSRGQRHVQDKGGGK